MEDKRKHDDVECDCCHDEDDALMTITMDDGTEVECTILGVFEAHGREYIALVPNDDSEEVLLYRYNSDDEISEIETDDEYDDVIEVFDSLMDNELYDDELDDDDFGFYEDEDSENEEEYYDGDLSIKRN